MYACGLCLTAMAAAAVHHRRTCMLWMMLFIFIYFLITLHTPTEEGETKVSGLSGAMLVCASMRLSANTEAQRVNLGSKYTV